MQYTRLDLDKKKSVRLLKGGARQVAFAQKPKNFEWQYHFGKRANFSKVSEFEKWILPLERFVRCAEWTCLEAP